MTKSGNGPEYKLEIGDKIVLLNNKKYELLKYIDLYGSITKSAYKTDIPYRSALKYLENLAEEAGNPLVSTQRGGKGGGGGSRLSKTGKLFLREYRKVSSVLDMHVDVNEIESKISEIDEDHKIIIVHLDDKKVILPLREDFKVGDDVLILISPEDIFLTLEPQKSSVRNIFKGKITGLNLKDQIVRLNVDIGKINLFADVTEYAREEMSLDLGKKVYINFKAAAIAVIKL
ncbi:MAG: transcriptional regulator [Methanobacteriales archaeon Met13]